MCLPISFLRPFAMFLGLILTLVSIGALCSCLYLLFGDPFPGYQSRGTYTPNWEDMAPALICAVGSLLANVLLIGGALQYSKNLVLIWIIWNSFLLVVFWAWYAYNQLKHYGMIQFRGMRSCYFCGLKPEESYVGMGGAAGSLVIFVSLILIIGLHSKLKKLQSQLARERYLYQSNQSLAAAQNPSYPYYQYESNQMLPIQQHQQYAYQYEANQMPAQYYPYQANQQQSGWYQHQQAQVPAKEYKF